MENLRSGKKWIDAWLSMRPRYGDTECEACEAISVLCAPFPLIELVYYLSFVSCQLNATIRCLPYSVRHILDESLECSDKTYVLSRGRILVQPSKSTLKTEGTPVVPSNALLPPFRRFAPRSPRRPSQLTLIPEERFQSSRPTSTGRTARFSLVINSLNKDFQSTFSIGQAL